MLGLPARCLQTQRGSGRAKRGPLQRTPGSMQTTGSSSRSRSSSLKRGVHLAHRRHAGKVQYQRAREARPARDHAAKMHCCPIALRAAARATGSRRARTTSFTVPRLRMSAVVLRL